MTYLGDQKKYASEIQENVALAEVTGGTNTNPAWTPEIENEAFYGAVKETLKSQGLYSDQGKYRLEAKILEVDQPLVGFDLMVTAHIRYILTNTDSGKVVLDETVVAPHTSTVSDAFVAVKRLRLANEGAAKKNIEGLLNRLSELGIAPEEVSLAK